MPTVLRVDGFRVLILFPPREHPPAHVHVINASGLCVVMLARGTKAQETTRVEGMGKLDQRRAERIVAENTSFLLEEWRRIHG